MKTPISIEFPRELALAHTAEMDVDANRLMEAASIAKTLTRDIRRSGGAPAGPGIRGHGE